MPYFCHVGNHLYEASETEEGCQHPICADFREVDVPPLGILTGSIQGHYTGTDPNYPKQASFEKDIHAYRKARAEGLQPPTSDQEGVAKAHEKVRSQKRALKKLQIDKDVDAKRELTLAPGVE